MKPSRATWAPTLLLLGIASCQAGLNEEERYAVSSDAAAPDGDAPKMTLAACDKSKPGDPTAPYQIWLNDKPQDNLDMGGVPIKAGDKIKVTCQMKDGCSVEITSGGKTTCVDLANGKTQTWTVKDGESYNVLGIPCQKDGGAAGCG